MAGRFDRFQWRAVVARYAGADWARSLWQVASTIGLLIVTLVIGYKLMPVAPWATALFVLIIAGLLVRTFIIMHDCAHGSFLPWPKVNDAVGFITGVLTFTPFLQWRRDHALHHASSGDLERRGTGDVSTLTVAEYEALSRVGKLKYRLYRHPIVLFGLGPIHMMVLSRWRTFSTSTGPTQLWNVWMTNLAIASTATIFILTAGWESVVLLYVPAMYLAAAGGIFLFYVQHQFEEAYWERGQQWDYATAAITGSSFLQLPPVLNWFTGNIGFHHVHHLGPKIPNYRLPQAHAENAIFEAAPVLTLRTAVKTLRLALWDEAQGKLVSFREIRARRVAR